MKKLLFRINNFFIDYTTVIYYLLHPNILFLHYYYVLKLWFNKMLHKDVNFVDSVKSTLPIDVVLVTAEKDFKILTYVVASIRKYIKHPIGEIIVISPKSDQIVDLCSKLSCLFIDENTVLPVVRKDIHYTVRNVDRSGWLFQQLLKYSAGKYCTNNYYLVTEADTIFVRPRVFFTKNKIIFPCANHFCHLPYFAAYKAVLGQTVLPLINFTSHHALIDKKLMRRLKLDIEEYTGKHWYRAIIDIAEKDTTDGSAISDYETYGQYIFANHENMVILEDWANISLSRNLLESVDRLSKKYSKAYKTVSFHSYND